MKKIFSCQLILLTILSRTKHLLLCRYDIILFYNYFITFVYYYRRLKLLFYFLIIILSLYLNIIIVLIPFCILFYRPYLFNFSKIFCIMMISRRGWILITRTCSFPPLANSEEDDARRGRWLTLFSGELGLVYGIVVSVQLVLLVTLSGQSLLLERRRLDHCPSPQSLLYSCFY